MKHVRRWDFFFFFDKKTWFSNGHKWLHVCTPDLSSYINYYYVFYHHSSTSQYSHHFSHSLSLTMFLKMNNPLKYLDEVRMKKKSYVASYAVPSSKSSSGLAIGLRIVLIQRSQTCQSNVVVKSTLKLSQPTSKRLTLQPTSLESCFLKSCHLCKRKLRPDKDIYMYR